MEECQSEVEKKYPAIIVKDIRDGSIIITVEGPVKEINNLIDDLQTNGLKLKSFPVLGVSKNFFNSFFVFSTLFFFFTSFKTIFIQKKKVKYILTKNQCI